jgi:hypothetical protein
MYAQYVGKFYRINNSLLSFDFETAFPTTAVLFIINILETTTPVTREEVGELSANFFPALDHVRESCRVFLNVARRGWS